MDLIIIRGKSR